MSDAPGDTSRASQLLGRYGGLVVAGLGFVITRFFVAEAVVLSGGPLAVAATVGSLVVGLVLAIAGVALAVGGIVNGHRKASLRRRRSTILRSVNRSRFINRLLRHEVLNAATIIDGHAELLRNEDMNRDRSVDAIRRGAARIESTVNGVGTIAEDHEDDAIRPATAIRDAVESVDVGDAFDHAASIEETKRRSRYGFPGRASIRRRPRSAYGTRTCFGRSLRGPSRAS